MYYKIVSEPYFDGMNASLCESMLKNMIHEMEFEHSIVPRECLTFVFGTKAFEELEMRYFKVLMPQLDIFKPSNNPSQLLGIDCLIDPKIPPTQIILEYRKDKFIMPPKDIFRYDKITLTPPFTKPEIKKVIFAPPATIVIWKDGTKTVVKQQEFNLFAVGTWGDRFDKEKGLAMAMCKKVFGTNKSQSNYYDIFKQWIQEDK